MKKKIKKILVGLLTAVMLTGSAGIITAQAAAGDPKPYEWQQLYLTNRERIARGLQPLTAFPKLTQAAQLRSKEQIESFGHFRPNESLGFSVLDQFDIENKTAAENVAAGQMTPAQVTSVWMNSPLHRSNILGSEYNHLGVGYVKENAPYGPHWVQLLIGGCTFRGLSVYDGTTGENYGAASVRRVRKGTSIEDMKLIGRLSCPHGTTIFPLDAALCSGYRPNRDDNIAHTVTVKAYGMQTKFKIMVTTPLNREPAPTLNRRAAGRNAVELKWSEVKGAEKYRIYRREGKSGAFMHIGTVARTNFTDKKAAAGKVFSYRVRAVRGTETGKYSRIRSIALAPAAPKLLSAALEPKAAGDPKPLEWKLLSVVNRERISSRGLDPLTMFPNLTKAARLRAKETLVMPISLYRPDGRLCTTVFDDFQIAHSSVTENIQQKPTVPEEVTDLKLQGLINYKNTRNPDYQHLGIGYEKGGIGAYWVQLFVGRGCTFRNFSIYDETAKENYGADTVRRVKKGTPIDGMNLVGKVSCIHGTTIFPLDAALCSGYRPSRADNIAHTVTVRAFGMKKTFKIMVTTPLNGEPAPTLNRRAAGRNAVELKWSEVKGAEKYRIYRRVGKSGAFTHIGTVARTNFTDKKAAAGVDLCYRVRAVRGTETGKYSRIRSIRLA